MIPCWRPAFLGRPMSGMAHETGRVRQSVRCRRRALDRYLRGVIDFALLALGYDDGFAAALEGLGTSGRVARLDRGACLVLTADGLVSATMDRRVDVAAGDWVAVADGAVAAVAPRRSAITRAQPSGAGASQVLAVNIDLVFVV